MSRNRDIKTADEIATEIRAELRLILRLRSELTTPLQRFEPVKLPLPARGPRFYVTFDLRPRRTIDGLHVGGIKSLSLPDERIENQGYELAKAIWHLKDRLHQYAKATVSAVNIRDFETEPALLLCSDLANRKKHGRFENRSRLNPKLGNVLFDTSGSGELMLFYDGSAKDKELVVERPSPIPFVIELLINNGKAAMGNAVDKLAQAFRTWLPLIETLGVLDRDDNESVALRNEFYPARS